MPSTWVTTWRLYRFELLVVLLAVGFVAVAAMVVADQLAGLAVGECAPDEDPEACAAAVAALRGQADQVAGLAGVAPLVAGVVLGPVLVAREVEHGTVQLGWSLSGARRQWLLERVLPVATVLVLGLAVLAFASDALEAARWPEVDPRVSLHGYGERGPLLVVRGLAVFAAGVLVGLVMGRQLPALLVAGLAAAAIGYGSILVFPYGADWRWERRTESVSEVADRVGPEAFRAPDGTTVSLAEVLGARVGEGPARWTTDDLEPIRLVLRGERLPEIEQREMLVLGMVIIVTLGASLVMVDRRRPY
ncbi:MAG: hypothetical protein KF809_05205 [Chloroflexi bacterium]|nr:hypothetical protein [Chloroflexota bacterium]